MLYSMSPRYILGKKSSLGVFSTAGPLPFKKLWFLIGPQRPSHLWQILTLIHIIMLYYYSSLSLTKL